MADFRFPAAVKLLLPGAISNALLGELSWEDTRVKGQKKLYLGKGFAESDKHLAEWREEVKKRVRNGIEAFRYKEEKKFGDMSYYRNLEEVKKGILGARFAGFTSGRWDYGGSDYHVRWDDGIPLFPLIKEEINLGAKNLYEKTKVVGEAAEEDIVLGGNVVKRGSGSKGSRVSDDSDESEEP
ncbi:hypothetical protein GLAREA_07936 [Glarea lozoyensis ATCC 20868]|uniref:Uncharacterized protein n=1 Tax=Glarea lozoyensis (strain ATCC 20868 / MF5171) TaxID=1116229 RepID=S3D2U2_GLAL2|nr:uncharacterized protein GLAREA_07936 [Glarea lozoyensis ATCC 20868]EPE32802.1 hypothetical protein GLAREA_07936 [Glarea lozoyensis ATCC 20868]